MIKENPSSIRQVIYNDSEENKERIAERKWNWINSDGQERRKSIRKKTDV
jgi:hypothetical protein